MPTRLGSRPTSSCSRPESSSYIICQEARETSNATLPPASAAPSAARLDHLPPVPRRIAEPGVHAAEARHGLLRELHPAGAHPVVGGAAVVDDQHERRHGALGHDL